MLPTYNIPPIGPKQGKIWGKTQLVFAYNSTEVHIIEGKAGYKCSCHSHDHKWNRFTVISGLLKIMVHHMDGTIDETLLGKWQSTDVPPGVKHQFIVMEDTMAIETYWVTLDAQDINRHGTIGGRSR